MPEVLTDADVFAPTVSVPADLDARNAASVRTPFKALSDRTAWLRKRLSPESPDTRHIVVPWVGFSSQVWIPSGSTQYAVSTGDGGMLYLDLTPFLRTGMRIQQVDVLVQPGAARAGADRLRAQWIRQGFDFDTPGSAITLMDSAFRFDDGTTDLQTISFTPTTVQVATDRNLVNLASDSFRVEVAAGDPHTSDRFYGARMIVSDPGPRNY